MTSLRPGRPSSPKKDGYFTGKAGYYAKYRRGYPPVVFDAILSRFALTPESGILDLGCGTGNVAIPLAGRGFHVYAVDPDLEMRKEGCRRAESCHVTGISWLDGADSTLGTLGLPPIRLCTMGLSFHWMDRPRVLSTLDTLIEPCGGIACISRNDSFFSHLKGGWGGAVKEVLQEMLGDSWDYSGRLKKKVENQDDRHKEVFLHSPFSAVEVIRFPVREIFTVDEIIGHQLSTSYTDPVIIGERNAEFRARLTKRLLAIEPSGTFPDESTIELIVARRPP
jgi:SAM-dependent methyltransferase